MSNLSMIAKIPEVRSAVLGDLGGGFFDAVREPDGEAIAAVMGFLASTVAQAGEHLGLGALRKIVLSGNARACVVAIRGEWVVTAYVEPAGAATTVEKALDSSLQVKR
jgi:hypothetical protein